MLNKINTETHEKPALVTNKNGFELYRLIYNMIDSIPENAAFYLDQQFMDMSHEWKPKIKSLKDLYTFKVVYSRNSPNIKRH